MYSSATKPLVSISRLLNHHTVDIKPGLGTGLNTRKALPGGETPDPESEPQRMSPNYPKGRTNNRSRLMKGKSILLQSVEVP